MLLALVTSLALCSGGPFERLKVLAGDWETSADAGAVVRVNFRLVSRGSALVQTYQPGERETLTVIHPDGDALVATHYCAQGNQPRLQLDAKASSATTAVFRFRDATNLPDARRSHLVTLELRLESPTAYTQVETYEENGKPDVTTLRFQRAGR